MKGLNMSIEKQKKDIGTLAEHYLNITCQNSSVVNQVIKEFGDVSLSAYLENFAPKTELSHQHRDDLIEVVYRYAAPLLGESIAKRASRDLAASPVVLTTNHHGVDYFSQSFQGSLIFSLNTIAGKTSAATVPIFSCGNVPLDNQTYPRGLLLYHVNHAELDNMPKKLPVFSDRLKRQMVSVATAFDQTMVRRAETRLEKMIRDRQISPTLAAPLKEILWEDYCAPSVISLSNYTQQSVVLNSRIWKRLFSKLSAVPEMVYLELEKIIGMLLESDLSNSESLAWCVMFDPVLRESILEELDGARACWEREKLAQRLRVNLLDKSQRKALSGCGTIFFWGIDDAGRRIPLYLETNGSNSEMLRGVDDRGSTWEVPYTPRSIIKGLHENRLLPSLFTCFISLSFARGVNCLGGYFKDEYFPVMQQGIVNALEKTTGYHDVAELVAQVPTYGYLSGMLAVMTRIEAGYLIPAGPVEIIAGGGIAIDDIEKMLSITVRDAHLAALFETIPDFASSESGLSDWKKQLAVDCFRLLKEKIVIK